MKSFTISSVGQRVIRVAPIAIGFALVLLGWDVSSAKPPCKGGDDTPDAYSGGLALWRKPDAMGRACASCHSPDGIELAAYAYDRATIIRRATPHQGAAAAARLASYLQALRSKLGLKGNLDPMTDRPMQPGGSVLPGATPVDRDRAFALSLYEILPTLMGERISTLPQAKSALAELLRLDPSKVRIGIDLNRLSEDKFHGTEHASLANWIPDVPPIPFSPDLQKAQDAYLASPTEDNFRALDGFYLRSWSRTLTPTQALALEKMRSLLIFQHKVRTGSFVHSMDAIPESRKGPPNPFWEIGDLARIYSNTQSTGLALPADVRESKTIGPSISTQLQGMRLPWFWLGWIADPGLQRTSVDRRIRYADWISEFLLEDGPYPAHAVFLLTKKIAAESYEPTGWGSIEPQHLDLNFSWVLREDNWRQFKTKDAKHKAALNRLMANSFRMFALLQADELSRTGVTYLREPVVQQLDAMQKAVATVDPSDVKADTQIFQKATEAVASARLFRP